MTWVVPLHLTQYPQSISYFTIYYPTICQHLIINFFSFILLSRFFCFINHQNSFSHPLIILLRTLLLMIRLIIMRKMTLLILVMAHLLFFYPGFYLRFKHLFFKVLFIILLKIPDFYLKLYFLGFTRLQQVLFEIIFLSVFPLFFRLN